MRYLPRKGSSTVPICVMIVIVCMILSVVIMYANAVNVVKITKQNTRVVLDSYVMTNSIEVYNSIKQGNDDNDSLDATAFTDSLSEFCTFVDSGNYLYNYDTDGKTQFYLSKPALGFTKDNSLKIYASYKVYVPIYFAGIQVSTAEIPVTVTSKFTEKF